jgi:hypothetical protein
MNWIVRRGHSLGRAALRRAREQAVLAQLDTIEAAMWLHQARELRRQLEDQ